MNCKPGDLAVIVIVGPRTQKALWKIVTILKRAPSPKHFKDLPAWRYEPEFSYDDGINTVACIHDFCVRPIRDPGEDATDEMVALLGKPASQPSKEHA